MCFFSPKCQLLKRLSDILCACIISPIRATFWHLWFCYDSYSRIVKLKRRMTSDEMWKNVEEWITWSMCMEGHKDVFEVEYLRTVVTDKNHLHKEIMSSLNSGIACQYSFHIVLFSHVLCKNIKIKIYRNNAVPCCMWVWWYIHFCNRKVLDMQQVDGDN